jgi:hypothetical protein
MSTIRKMNELADTIAEEAFELEEALSPAYKNPYLKLSDAELKKRRNSFLDQIDDLVKFKKKKKGDKELVDLEDKLKQINYAMTHKNESADHTIDMNAAFEALDEALDEALEEGYYTVVYKDKKGKVQGEKDFKDKAAAEKHAARGNAVDKVGGKYDVFFVNESLEEALDESTKAYAASLEKIANDKKLKNISNKDREMLAKIANMMKNANEESISEGAETYTVSKGTYTRKVDGKTADLLKKQGWKLMSREEVMETVELEEVKVPANYAQMMMMKKRKEFKKNQAAGDKKDKKSSANEEAVEVAELEEHVRKSAENTVKGVKWGMNENRYGLTASLIAAVNSVVTGENTTPIAADTKVDVQEGAEGGTGDKEAYQKFFQAALKKFGASSPADLDDKKKKEFYDYVDANWKGDNEVAEEALIEFKASGEDSEIPDPIATKAKQPMKGKKTKAESKDGKEDKKGGEKVIINPNLKEAPEMTDAQMKKREEIVMSMKDKTPEFKKKYGDRWKDVMYATATKLAMK